MRGIEWNGPEWYFSEYSKCLEDALKENSNLYQFGPDVILVSIHGSENFRDVTRILGALSENTKAKVFVHNIIDVVDRPLRFLKQSRTNRELNVRLDILCDSIPVQILDLQDLERQLGKKNLIDHRLFFLAQRPFSNEGMKSVSGQFKKAVETLVVKRKKCLILDLDNTLWGGLLADGITLSREGPGKAFYEFQKSIKELAQSGVILAICSKNDEDQALKTIENHPDMVLRKEDFAAWRINWRDKPSNIREIAEELNIGIDSIVFFDDSLHELDAVSSILKFVVCPNMPEDPAYYCDWLSKLTLFDTFSLTDTDQQRNEMYVQERHRRELSKNMNYDEYLKSLKIKIIILKMTENTSERVCQLSERTNQFNINGDRYKKTDIKKAYTISYEDRFGSQGIVGAAILDEDEEAIMGLYISCRILGKGVEQTLMSKLYPRMLSVRDTGKNKAALEFIQNFQEGVPEWVEIESCEL